jgi:mRNA-degrading endonuclease RelE of RelBE toxin-antitoxin system
MTERYTVFVHSDLRDIRLGRYKHPIQNFIHSLADNPFDRSDYPDMYREREGEVKIIGPYAVIYELDHSVKRVLVLEILHADE